jgi:hypothetical protein
VKRLVLLIGLPVLLGLVWWSGEAGRANAAADVTIDTAKVVEVRGVVISRLAGVGATKTAESTSYSDDGRSDLTFRIPPTRLEEALVELNLVGGEVTEQRVQLEELSADAADLTSGLDGLGGCLDDVATQLDSRQLIGATDDVAECRKQLEEAGKRLEETPEAAEDAVLNVHITKASTTSPLLIVAVALLALALATMAYLTVRSTRGDHVFDVTDQRPARPTHDLYDRRN